MVRLLQSVLTRACLLFLLCCISAITLPGIFARELPTSQTLTGLPFCSLPSGHPASTQFSAWLRAFNSVDRETLVSYHNISNIGMVDPELKLANFTGGFDVVDVESSSEPSSVVVVLKAKNRPLYVRVAMLVDVSKANYPTTNFEIRPTVTPLKFIPKDDPRRPQWEKALKPLTPALRRAVVEGLVEVLREQYIDPQLGKEIIAGLSARLQNGDYDGVEESYSFSRRLRMDLYNISHHQPIFVAFAFSEPQPEHKGDADDKPAKHLDDLRRVNFGFGSVSFDIESVPGRTIATLPISRFVHSTAHFALDWQEIQTAIGTILSSIAHADALLVDLRSNTGGDPNTVAFILSYLLDDGPVHLLDFVNRSGAVVSSFSTNPAHELPSDTTRFGGTKPVYVLTSNWTIGGGEDMAYSLQAFKRASAVIGEGNEATRGTAGVVVPNDRRFICEEEFGNGWWFMVAPSLRPIHAVTGTNWEGTGVQSDVVAGRGEWARVSDAKEVGTRLARQDLNEKKEELGSIQLRIQHDVAALHSES